MNQTDERNVIDFLSRRDAVSNERAREYAKAMRAIADEIEKGGMAGFLMVIDTGSEFDYISRGISLERQIALMNRLIYKANKKWDGGTE